jgi:hypothetical protein
LPADVRSAFASILGVVAEERHRGRNDLQVIVRTPIRGQTPLDVREERLPIGQAGMAAEDHVCLLGGELASTIAVAGLDLHRVALGTPWHVELSADRELVTTMLERGDAAVCDEHAVLGVSAHGVVGPAVPQCTGGDDELAGAVVTKLSIEEPAPAEVLTRERVG